MARTISHDLAQKKPGSGLYHYVKNLDTLQKIVSSRTLWASDPTRLNDDTELVHGLPMCRDVLGAIDDVRLQWIAGAVKDGLDERFRYSTFVTCFSETASNSQCWREYGGNGKGFVIRFDPLLLTALHAVPGLRLMPVAYGPEQQLSRAVQKAQLALWDIYSYPYRSFDWFAYTAHARLTLLGVDMFYLCTSSKSAEKWEAEQEWRMIYCRHPLGMGLPIRTRQTNGIDIEYVAMSLVDRYIQQDLPCFAKVIAGEQCEAQDVEAARECISQHEPSTLVEVKSSQPSVRNMADDIKGIREASREIASSVLPILEEVEGSRRLNQVGTGFILRHGNQGCFVTAHHVINGPQRKLAVLSQEGDNVTWPKSYTLLEGVSPATPDADIAYAMAEVTDDLDRRDIGLPLNLVMPNLEVRPTMSFIAVGYPGSKAKVDDVLPNTEPLRL